MSSKAGAATKARAKRNGPKYRAIRENIIHDPAFQRLTADAKALWLVFKCEGRASGIFVQYRATLSVLASLTPERLDAALDELVAGGWAEHEGNVFWLVRALEEDPHLTVTSETSNHAIPVIEHIAQLPPLEIVNRFAEHYRLPLPFPALRKARPVLVRDPVAEAPVTVTAVPVAGDAEDAITESTLIGLVRALLYKNRKEPQEGAAGRDRSVIRAMIEKGYTTGDIAEAIEGLSMMRDHDRLQAAGPESAVTMRLLFDTRHGALSLFTEARDYRRQILGKAAHDSKRMRDLVAKVKGEA
jgi:hypothetical protein